VLGFLHYLFLLRVGSWLDYIIDGIYLRKVGWVFPLGLGFSQDKLLCLLVLVYVAHIFSTWYMIVNVKEDLSTLVILML
jgi:hypothetical protein